MSMFASKNGHTETLQALDVNYCNGMTALDFAAQGHTETVQALLAAEADVNVQTKNGMTTEIGI